MVPVRVIVQISALPTASRCIDPVVIGGGHVWLRNSQRYFAVIRHQVLDVSISYHTPFSNFGTEVHLTTLPLLFHNTLTTPLRYTTPHTMPPRLPTRALSALQPVASTSALPIKAACVKAQALHTSTFSRRAPSFAKRCAPSQIVSSKTSYIEAYIDSSTHSTPLAVTPPQPKTLTKSSASPKTLQRPTSRRLTTASRRSGTLTPRRRRMRLRSFTTSRLPTTLVPPPTRPSVHILELAHT